MHNLRSLLTRFPPAGGADAAGNIIIINAIIIIAYEKHQFTVRQERRGYDADFFRWRVVVVIIVAAVCLSGFRER